MTQEAGQIVQPEPWFEEVQPGVALEPVEMEITADAVERYLNAIDNRHSWYTQDSPFGGPIVLPTVLEQLALTGLIFKTVPVRTKGGSVHAMSEIEYKKPVPIGSKVRVEGQLLDKYIRRDKYYIVFQTRVLNEQGEEVLRAKYAQARLPRLDQTRAR